ncbi:MAG: GNAT family N-acetyltransferase [Solirubrobacterales bacterium]|nr:GNAT family N-acetyltransferase [Solirubrobacterales bacterium]
MKSAAMRRARVEDAAQIRELVVSAYAHYPSRIGVRPAPLDLDYATEIAEKEVWLASIDGEPRGVLVIRCDGERVIVDNVAVAPDAQRSGLGRALLAQAEARAAALGAVELRLLTHELMTENRRIYERLGWEPIEAPPDERFSRVHFRKPVSRE